MAREMPAVAYFRCRLNDQAPLFVARFEHDAVQMRTHPEFFECDKDGNGLKGEVALPKYVPAAEEVEQVPVVEPGPRAVFSVAPKVVPAAKPKKK